MMDTLEKEKDSMKERMEKADIKVILIGDAAVGKSKMIERFLENDYNKFRLSTHALTLYRKDVKLGGGEVIKTDLWDTGGQEKFNSLHASYYFQANAAIMVFDVTRKATYVNLRKWYEELRVHCEDIPVILVANKIDIDHLVTRKNYKFAEKHNLPLFFVSNADGTNVVKVFEEAIYAAVGHKKFGGRTFVDEALELFQEDVFQVEEVENGEEDFASCTNQVNCNIQSDDA